MGVVGIKNPLPCFVGSGRKNEQKDCRENVEKCACARVNEI